MRTILLLCLLVAAPAPALAAAPNEALCADRKAAAQRVAARFVDYLAARHGMDASVRGGRVVLGGLPDPGVDLSPEERREICRQLGATWDAPVFGAITARDLLKGWWIDEFAMRFGAVEVACPL